MTTSLLISADIALAFVAWGAAYLLREFMLVRSELSGVALATVFSSIALWIGLRVLLGLYPGYGLDSVEKLRRHAYSVFAALAIFALLALGFQIGDLVSRLLLGVSFLGLIFLAPLVRQALTSVLKHIGLWGKPVIVLSYKDTGNKFIELLRAEWGLGYKPVALFDYNLVPAGQAFSEVPYQETLADAEKFAYEQGIDTVIFAMPYTRRDQLAHMVRLASKNFRYVLILPNLTGVTNSAVIARDLGGTFAVEIKHNLLDPWARRLKRTLDLSCAVAGGVLVSPLILLIVLLIKLDSEGNAFYGHKRLGADDEYFPCWKFRTMRADADRLLEQFLASDPELKLEWEQSHKLRKDPRVTRIGGFLRKTSLDELPQLWNVLRGEMSLIGPRPIVSDEVPKYREGYELYRRIRPGMSGLWQVSGRSDTDYDERVEMDSYYVRNWSVWLDVVILARTIKIVLRGRGAY